VHQNALFPHPKSKPLSFQPTRPHLGVTASRPEEKPDYDPAGE